MKSTRQFNRTDAAILLITLLLLLGNLAAVGSAGRERAKRAVCLDNLRALTQAWRQFADDHDGQLVNGMGGVDRWASGTSAKAWVGKCWDDNYQSGELLSEDLQEQAIQYGALWPYVEELKLYRCPSGYAGEKLNYMIADGMNGLWRSGTVAYDDGLKGVHVGDTVVWVQNFREIMTPGPAERMVFIDAGRIAPDSFSTHYKQETWWDAPPIRHNDGTTVSFADGHSEYWQWQGTDTIEYGRHNDQTHISYDTVPETAEGREDLHRLQRAVWGRLGYELQ
jgi:prepilin-type processing-associated H-X9-DG protein